MRVDEVNRLRTEKPSRRVIKISHWLLLGNWLTIPAEQFL